MAECNEVLYEEQPKPWKGVCCSEELLTLSCGELGAGKVNMEFTFCDVVVFTARFFNQS